MKHLILLLTVLFLSSCGKEAKEEHDDTVQKPEEKSAEVLLNEKNAATDELVAELKERGFQTFDYIDEESGEKVVMQQYFIAFLKRGPNRSQSEEEAAKLQEQHLAHLGEMYKKGYADISGPFGDDGDIRGITIYNVPTLQMADSLANMDPSVKAGRLVIEIHPWWAAKGFPLR
ncbi:YciI family protein [Sungkyunkwania multivorans]|uniref:YciI family protein n=1 Tax=Sungkyunkwania multivorans TaxID=1173618 RepID=A0ABW3D0V9_9FLAO